MFKDSNSCKITWGKYAYIIIGITLFLWFESTVARDESTTSTTAENTNVALQKGGNRLLSTRPDNNVRSQRRLDEELLDFNSIFESREQGLVDVIVGMVSAPSPTVPSPTPVDNKDKNEKDKDRQKKNAQNKKAKEIKAKAPKAPKTFQPTVLNVKEAAKQQKNKQQKIAKVKEPKVKKTIQPTVLDAAAAAKQQKNKQQKIAKVKEPKVKKTIQPTIFDAAAAAKQQKNKQQKEGKVKEPKVKKTIQPTIFNPKAQKNKLQKEGKVKEPKVQKTLQPTQLMITVTESNETNDKKAPFRPGANFGDDDDDEIILTPDTTIATNERPTLSPVVGQSLFLIPVESTPPSFVLTSSPSSTTTLTPSLPPVDETIEPSLFFAEESNSPSSLPTVASSSQPSLTTSESPSNQSFNPSNIFSISPTELPSLDPTILSSVIPSSSPTKESTTLPTLQMKLSSITSFPSTSPTIYPSAIPSSDPSLSLSITSPPSNVPSPDSLSSLSITTSPSNAPSPDPSLSISTSPSNKPSSLISTLPSNIPTLSSSTSPSEIPTFQISSLPSIYESDSPSIISQPPPQRDPPKSSRQWDLDIPSFTLSLEVAALEIDKTVLLDVTQTHLSIVFSQNIFFHHLELSTTRRRNLIESEIYVFEFFGSAWFEGRKASIDINKMIVEAFEDFYLVKYVEVLRESGIAVVKILVEYSFLDGEGLSIDSLEKRERKANMNLVKIYGIAVAAALLTVVVGILMYRRQGSIDPYYTEEEFSFDNNLEFQVIEPSSLNNGSNSTALPDNRSEQLRMVRYNSFSETDGSSESSNECRSGKYASTLDSGNDDYLYNVDDALAVFADDNRNRTTTQRPTEKHVTHDYLSDDVFQKNLNKSQTSKNKTVNPSDDQVITGRLIEIPTYHDSGTASTMSQSQTDAFRINNIESRASTPRDYLSEEHDNNARDVQITSQHPPDVYRISRGRKMNSVWKPNSTSHGTFSRYEGENERSSF